jgi:hypothetical protein
MRHDFDLSIFRDKENARDIKQIRRYSGSGMPEILSYAKDEGL